MHTLVILIGFTAAVLIGLSIRRFWVALPLVIGLLFLTMATANAYAGISQNVTYSGGVCYKWHLRETKDGLIGGIGMQPLFHIDQTVKVCKGAGGGFIRRPTRSYSHWEGAFWNWGGWDAVHMTHRRSPNRYVFTVKATENGETYTFYNDHCYPKIRQVVYPSQPGAWSQTANNCPWIG